MQVVVMLGKSEETMWKTFKMWRNVGMAVANTGVGMAVCRQDRAYKIPQVIPPHEITSAHTLRLSNVHKPQIHDHSTIVALKNECHSYKLLSDAC